MNFVIGDESLNGVLRLLTVSELFAHSEFYANHPQLADTARASGYSIPAILNIFLSDQKAQDMYNGNENSVARAIEVLAKETAKPFVYSSQFHVLALASVLGKPIHSVYPDIPSSLSIKKALHGVFYPREALLSDVSGSCQTSDLVAVMWTRIQRSPLHGWRPNHFVPLVKSSTCTPITSYASAVKYGRGMPYEASRGSRSPKPFQSLYDDPRTIKSKRSLSHADHTTSDSTLPAAKEHEFLPKAKNVSFKDFPSVAVNNPEKIVLQPRAKQQQYHPLTMKAPQVSTIPLLQRTKRTGVLPHFLILSALLRHQKRMNKVKNSLCHKRLKLQLLSLRRNSICIPDQKYIDESEVRVQQHLQLK